MSTSLIWLAILAGVLIAAGLIHIILKQLRAMKSPPAEEMTVEDFLPAGEPAPGQRERISDSIRVIARCLLDRQMELSEGCIRIKVLLDFIAPELHAREPYSIFNQIYLKLEHMPTHQARKDTDKKTIRKLDKERFAIENENETKIREAATAILGFFPERLS